MLQVTAQVDEKLIQDAVQNALRTAFQASERWGTGEGAKVVQRQVESYARSLDYSPYIERMAAPIIEEAVRSALEKVIAKEVKRQIDAMKTNGALGALFEAAQS
jgi:hypothetical protein